MNYAPAWALAAALLKGYYDDFKKRNPVKLTSALLAEFRVSKDQKSKGLKCLPKLESKEFGKAAQTIHNGFGVAVMLLEADPTTDDFLKRSAAKLNRKAQEYSKQKIC